MVVLSSGPGRALLLGDAAHCPVELIDDEWAGMGDMDAVAAMRTREAIVREVTGTPVLVAGAHFPGMRLGRLATAGTVRSWIPGT